MNFPLSMSDLTEYLISNENMESNEGWAIGLIFEEIIEAVVKSVIRNDLEEYECIAFFYDDDDESCDLDAPAMITLKWNKDEGFSGIVAMQYPSDKIYHDIDISDIQMKKYGAYEIPDIELVVEKGLEFFNQNFDIERYNREAYE